MPSILPATPMRRLISAAAVLAIGVTAACSETTAPTPLAPRAEGSRLLAAVDTTLTTFTYDPRSALEQSFSGGHRVSLPAGAVCDPLTSGYGTGTWDAACKALARPITFVARSWTDASGRPRMTFTPDVRFVPGKTVTLRLKDKDASITAGSRILWCPTLALTCVDEGAADASLLTYRDANNMFVYRRLKHFSGYQIILGRESGDGSMDGGY